MTANDLAQTRSANLVPAKPREISKFVAQIAGSMKLPGTDTIADPRAYFAAMRIAVERKAFPAVVFNEALMRLVDEQDWTPSTAKVLAVCRTVHIEIRRRAREIEDQERECRRIAEQQAEQRRRETQLKAVFAKRYGDDSDFDTALNAIRRLFGDFEVEEWFSAIRLGSPWALKAASMIAAYAARSVDDDAQTRDFLRRWFELRGQSFPDWLFDFY